MRVLVVAGPGSFQVVGGHLTQQQETIRALNRAGVAARFGTPQEAVEGDDDIVHFFGRDVRPLLRVGRPKGRLVVTPIYFPRWLALGPYYQRPGYRHIATTRMRHHASWFRRPKDWLDRYRDFNAAGRALRAADRLVVNSRAEAALLRHDVWRLPEVGVAYSGVASAAFDGDAHYGRHLLGTGEDPFVLCVGRVEPIKNTLALALAARAISIRLVVVGAVLPGNEPYMEAVRKAAPDLIHHSHLDHDVVRHVHAAATAHALPSWFETTGLSTLEALAAGTPVVVGNGSCQREYFGACASFCRPASVRSIRRAILRALETPCGTERDVARRYNWDRTASELIDIYAAIGARAAARVRPG